MSSKAWLVLTTRSRFEKKVTSRLISYGYEVYCPLKEEKRKWSDRSKKVSMPLLPGYVFIRIAPESKNQVFSIEGVVSYLFWLGKPAVIRDEEIETLRRFLNDFSHELIEAERVSANQHVKILSGPLQGREALVEEVSASKVALYLEGMGYRVSVDCRSTLLEVTR